MLHDHKIIFIDSTRLRQERKREAIKALAWGLVLCSLVGFTVFQALTHT
jgi:hypothetical protein